MGGGPDLGFGGCGGGWGTLSGFWGLRRHGYQVGVDGLMVTVCCRSLAMVAERGRREINGFFFKLFKKIIIIF